MRMIACSDMRYSRYRKTQMSLLELDLRRFVCVCKWTMIKINCCARIRSLRARSAVFVMNCFLVRIRLDGGMTYISARCSRRGRRRALSSARARATSLTHKPTALEPITESPKAARRLRYAKTTRNDIKILLKFILHFIN